MTIEYDGTDFYGWQYQPDKRTVQGDIEGALKRLTNETIRIIGAGRTDQGVHALGQVANFHALTNLPLCQMRQGINSLTRDDINVKSVESVDNNFHSRFSAKAKVYRYQLLLEPSPLRMRYGWYTRYKLDVPNMRRIIPNVLGEHDFKNLSAHNEAKKTLCTIIGMSLTVDAPHIIIEIEGNRFLRKMIRGIVGFMYDVGRGRFSPENTHDVFGGIIKDIYFAPPHGLYLAEVKY